MKGHSLMGHRGKVQKHLGDRPICRSLERKGKWCFSRRSRPVTQGWILAEGARLDGVAHFSTCLPVGHTLGVLPSGWFFSPHGEGNHGHVANKKKKIISPEAKKLKGS